MTDIKGFSLYVFFLSILLVFLEIIAYSYIGEMEAYFLFAFIIIKIVLVVVFFLQLVAFITTKNKKLILAMLFPIASIFIVSSHIIEKTFQKTDQHIYLTQYCNQTIHPLSLKLKEDKTFEYTTGLYLEKVIYHGVYDLSCDSLELTFNEIVPEELVYELLEKQKKLAEISYEVKKSQIKLSLNMNTNKE